MNTGESTPKHPELFPIAYGNEEETMLLQGPVGGKPNTFEPAIAFLEDLNAHMPKGVRTVSEGNRLHTQAGAVVYRTGLVPAELLEGATPECSTPTEIVTQIQSTNERLKIKMLSGYVVKQAELGQPIEVRMQRRSVDGHGHTAGTHDNLEGRRPSCLKNFEESNTSDANLAMIAHLATRSFMTGAGHASEGGLYYAQKVQNLQYINRYGFLSSALRVSSEADTGPRLEIRCNDINLQPWSIKSRVVGAALVFTALQTELAKRLSSQVPPIVARPSTQTDAFRAFNVAYLEPEGTLKGTDFTYQAVDFQEQQFTLLAERLDNYIDLDDEHRDILEGNILYCQDFRKVLNGEDTVRSLANRSDNAVKFAKIAASVARGLEDGFKRTTTDWISRMWDMRYDNIRITPGSNKQARVEYGYGYKWRDNSSDRVSEDAIERGVYYPPQTTRAHVRGHLIRHQQIDWALWNQVTLGHKPTGLETLSCKKFRLPDAVLTDADRQLSPEDYIRLRSIELK